MSANPIVIDLTSDSDFEESPVKRPRLSETSVGPLTQTSYQEFLTKNPRVSLIHPREFRVKAPVQTTMVRSPPAGVPKLPPRDMFLTVPEELVLKGRAMVSAPKTVRALRTITVAAAVKVMDILRTLVRPATGPRTPLQLRTLKVFLREAFFQRLYPRGFADTPQPELSADVYRTFMQDLIRTFYFRTSRNIPLSVRHLKIIFAIANACKF